MPEKEIGKLLELLNEYDPYIMGNGEKGDNFWFIVSRGGSVVFLKENGIQMIISKSYGFIQRLVEQDKIRDDGIKPRKDLVKEITIVDYDTGKAIGWKNKYSETEQLLMYLSIQENPISFLCSILR